MAEPNGLEARADLGLPAPVDRVVRGAVFLGSLWWHLRRPLSLAEAERAQRRRFERRGADLLTLLRLAVYPHPNNVYRRLLAQAGCELGDFERLIAQEGVEGALQDIFRRGVYLTGDELKGRRPLVRGSVRIPLTRGWQRNPRWRVPSPRAAAAGRIQLTSIYLASFEDAAITGALTMAAAGRRRWANWGVTGQTEIYGMIRARAAGLELARWLLQIRPNAPGLELRYRWTAPTVRLVGRLAGVALPALEYLPLTDPLPLARWLAGELQAGRRPSLSCFTSSALLICRAAALAGLDLTGALLVVGGEPLTSRRLALLRASGALIQPVYASSETGWIGRGCLQPAWPDDLHLLSDQHIVIQPGPAGARPGLPADGLLHTVPRPSWPLVALNLSLGDRANLAERRCGCPLERPGWTTHLYTVRSYEKLTAGGMTFHDVDVIRILEEVLPAHFGGEPTDYQLLEDELDDGLPRVRLLVHPRVGPLDPERVEAVFVHAVGRAAGWIDQEEQWRDARWVRVERRAPLVTANGKIQHLISRSTRLAPAEQAEGM